MYSTQKIHSYVQIKYKQFELGILLINSFCRKSEVLVLLPNIKVLHGFCITLSVLSLCAYIVLVKLFALRTSTTVLSNYLGKELLPCIPVVTCEIPCVFKSVDC